MHDFLPRQARDKHRENSKKSGVPLAHVGFFDCVDDESVLIYENEHIFFGRHFVLKMHRFTKTGSGQTYGKHSERDLCVFPMFLGAGRPRSARNGLLLARTTFVCPLSMRPQSLYQDSLGTNKALKQGPFLFVRRLAKTNGRCRRTSTRPKTATQRTHRTCSGQH